MSLLRYYKVVPRNEPGIVRLSLGWAVAGGAVALAAAGYALLWLWPVAQRLP